jgi:endonuclease/exonuclease/phosphatase family metal-dependent hydrolase
VCNLVYAVSDDRGAAAPPRIYVFRIDVDPPGVHPIETITLLGRDGEPFDRGVLDGEALALAPDGTLWLGAEGIHHLAVPPRILGFRLDGRLIREIPAPAAYVPGDGVGARSNAGFEGLGITPNGSRIVVAVESPLVQDGATSDLDRGSRTRIAVFDAASGGLLSERAHALGPVPDPPKPPTAYRSIGVSELLVIDEWRVLLVERSFSAGVGNRVRLVLADLASGDDVTGSERLEPGVRVVDTAVIVDLADLGVEPDNIEGMTMGPRLPDGRASLVLVADNNFQPAVQRNQLLVLAVDGIDSPEHDRRPTTIAEVQGADHVSPLVGRCVSGVEGTVTAILGQRSGQAFWIQAPADGDLATSDGLFVTAADGLPEAAIGAAVRLGGRVEERAWGAELPVTRLFADELEVIEDRTALPAPVLLGESGRRIPSPVIDDDGLTVFEPDLDAVDFFESLEGMWVEVEDPVVVGPTSRHGELVVLASNGDSSAPRSSRGGVVREPDNAHPERIIIADRLAPDAPPVAVGARLAGPLAGVMHYSYGAFKLLSTAPIGVDRPSGHRPEATSLAADEDRVTVATYNVENLSAVSEQHRIAAVAETVVDLLRSPTVLALQEIQDDSGPEDDGTVSAELTLERLVEAVAGAGGPRYRWLQVDPVNNADGGQPGGNIRVVVLFDPSRARVGEDGPDLLPASPMVVGGADPVFADSRKPLVVELELDGTPVVVVVCHLRSKGGDDRLFGRRQPPVRWTEKQRVPQAERVRALVETVLESDPEARVVVLGDLNDFEFSDALGVLASPPMANLMERLPAAERSTYVYRGNSQTLDHIIVSAPLADEAEIEVVHVNSDVPASERASDHDPVIARLEVGD